MKPVSPCFCLPLNRCRRVNNLRKKKFRKNLPEDRKISLARGRKVWKELDSGTQKRVLSEFGEVYDETTAKINAGEPKNTGKHTNAGRRLRGLMLYLNWTRAWEDLFSIWKVYHRTQSIGDLPMLTVTEKRKVFAVATTPPLISVINL